MCKQCIFLGALFNASEMDRFQCHTLSKYDFRISRGSQNLIDKRAAEYLALTIEEFQQVYL